MTFIKKNLSNIIFVLVIGLVLFPPTKVYFIRLVSFSPSTISKEKRVKLSTNHWQLKGLNTGDINLKELDNQVIFVSFWATWCPPCIAEMPSMQNLYNDYRDKVAFLFVTNENRQTVSKFLKKKGYNLPVYNQVGHAPKELEGKSLPTTYMINKDRDIVIRKVGAANWNSESTRKLLDTLLK